MKKLKLISILGYNLQFLATPDFLLGSVDRYAFSQEKPARLHDLEAFADKEILN